METWLILNDLHLPFQSTRAVKLAVKFANWLKPSGIIGNGDIVDCYSVSRFVKNPSIRITLAKEKRLAREFWQALPKAKTRLWLCGNHEDRLRRYVWENSERFLPLGDDSDEARKKLAFKEVFQVDKLGVEWRRENSGVHLGKLYVTHGQHALQHSAYSARKHFDKYGVSVLHGHSHRLGAYYKTDLGGPKAAFENGCLCAMMQDYVPSLPNWQHGFSVVHVDKGGLFSVVQIPILSQSFCYFGGKRFDA